MVCALGDGYVKFNIVHFMTSSLFNDPRPGFWAPDRQADPVEASGLAGESAAVHSGGRPHPEPFHDPGRVILCLLSFPL